MSDKTTEKNMSEVSHLALPTNSKATPLWIIGSFVSVSEVVAGITVVNTDGIVQAAALAFMALFTFFVASMFFLILWKRSEVFFPPDQYKDVNIKDFVKYVGSGRGSREKQVVRDVTSEIEDLISSFENEFAAGISDKKSSELRQSIEKINEKFIDVKVDPKLFEVTDREPISFSLFNSGWETVSDFLNEVYFKIVDQKISVPIFTYGQEWALKNERTGKTLKKVNSGENHDDRPFSQLELQAGDRLVVIPLF